MVRSRSIKELGLRGSTRERATRSVGWYPIGTWPLCECAKGLGEWRDREGHDTSVMKKRDEQGEGSE